MSYPQEDAYPFETVGYQEVDLQDFNPEVSTWEVPEIDFESEVREFVTWAETIPERVHLEDIHGAIALAELGVVGWEELYEASERTREGLAIEDMIIHALAQDLGVSDDVMIANLRS